MKQSLKTATQQHLENRALSLKQINQLQLLQEKHGITISNNHFPWYKSMAVAAVVMLSVLSLYFVNPAYFSSASIEQRIAEEVAANHLKLKPLEVKGNTLHAISGYFKQLNFSPVQPLSLQFSKQNLLGARYCSIQGITALQLRMVNPISQKVQTLYETDYDKQVFKNFPKTEQGSQPITLYVKGMKVDMWVEKGLLFALIE